MISLVDEIADLPDLVNRIACAYETEDRADKKDDAVFQIRNRHPQEDLDPRENEIRYETDHPEDKGDRRPPHSADHSIHPPIFVLNNQEVNERNEDRDTEYHNDQANKFICTHDLC